MQRFLVGEINSRLAVKVYFIQTADPTDCRSLTRNIR